jgi:phosphatidylserine/phosphatidylglycerophosphate/cardiolipin synthase-like enzyme
VRSHQVSAAFAAVYASDWLDALLQAGIKPQSEYPPMLEHYPVVSIHDGDTLEVRPVASPVKHRFEEAWDEPRIVALIDSAKTSVSVQLLTYRPVSGGEYYDVLEGALKRAAARGVQVRLLVADWCKRPTTIPYIKSLTFVPNVQVRMMTIPEWSGGFIPYARTIHAKYMVVDGRAGWIGTSNWEKDYFYESRNVGVIVESAKIGGILTRFFDGNWESEYAYAVDPTVEYEVPRIGE